MVDKRYSEAHQSPRHGIYPGRMRQVAGIEQEHEPGSESYGYRCFAQGFAGGETSHSRLAPLLTAIPAHKVRPPRGPLLPRIKPAYDPDP